MVYQREKEVEYFKKDKGKKEEKDSPKGKEISTSPKSQARIEVRES